MVVSLHEAVHVQLLIQLRTERPVRVPAIRLVRVEALEIPGEVEETLRRFRGDRPPDDDVAVRLPVGEVLLGQHPQRSRLLQLPQGGLCQI